MWSILICRLSRVTMLDGRIGRGIQSLLLPLKTNRTKIQSTKRTCRMELIHSIGIDKILYIILLINSDQKSESWQIRQIAHICISSVALCFYLLFFVIIG